MQAFAHNGALRLAKRTKRFGHRVRAQAKEIEQAAIEEGMLTLRMSGLSKIIEGVTTIEEVARVTAAD